MAARQYRTPPPMSIDPERRYSAVLHTTKGDVTIELFARDAPITTNNFVFLAREGFYDGVTFHRVLPGFVAQGGDPTGTGAGGPGYRFRDEVSARKNVTGAVSMANAGPNTNGSQFFICYTDLPHLDGRHAVFGRVAAGMEVALSFAARDPSGGGRLPPGDAIESVEIIEE